MGRKTWESFPARIRPMPGRDNIVVTRNAAYDAPGALVVGSVEQALAAADPAKQLWCIGGGEIYAQMIGLADRLEVTEVDIDAPGDAFAPPIGDDWRQASVDPESGWHESPEGLRYRYVSYLR
ncbi:hypothetical protein GCM10022287_12220 [Gryllotalpicola koreensis]|uniref:dihydrofolate reductase n=2 Tax=Gryllotalpicola koreensis TaxID=993086 RepID=A0ABP7ZWF8_9MICO